jgi:hypothetical protein
MVSPQAWTGFQPPPALPQQIVSRTALLVDSAKSHCHRLLELLELHRPPPFRANRPGFQIRKRLLLPQLASGKPRLRAPPLLSRA